MSEPAPGALVVDDEAFVRDSIAEILRADGWRTREAGGAREAIESLAAHGADVVVCDLRMPGGDAFQLLEHAQRGSLEIPIVVITGVGTVAEAVRAMKAGAYDFLQKPVDPDELVLVARRAAGHRRLLGEVRALRETIQGLRAPRVLVGSSEPIRRARALIAQVAGTDATVLVRGESGTGKELAAEEVHRQSRRSGEPFVRVACAAQTEAGFDRELGVPAGTLVLDEVGVLPPALQARLLHHLESRAPRLVAITNEDLPSRVNAGTFRADLYFRLAVFPIEMPPLRDHKEDIPEIVEHLLGWARRRAPLPGPTREAFDVLSTYGWPGNVRELRNVLERAMILASDGPLDAPLFRAILESAVAPAQAAGPGGARELHLRRNLDAAEKEIVLRAIAQTQGKKREAAILLGIDPRNLGYYLRKHGIADARPREPEEEGDA